MNDSMILTKLNELPETLKKEVLDFIEFLIKKQETVPVEKHPTAGCMKGTFMMKDDFDEPLEDFQEYTK